MAEVGNMRILNG